MRSRFARKRSAQRRACSQVSTAPSLVSFSPRITGSISNSENSERMSPRPSVTSRSGKKSRFPTMTARVVRDISDQYLGESILLGAEPMQQCIDWLHHRARDQGTFGHRSLHLAALGEAQRKSVRGTGIDVAHAAGAMRAAADAFENVAGREVTLGNRRHFGAEVIERLHGRTAVERNLGYRERHLHAAQVERAE